MQSDAIEFLKQAATCWSISNESGCVAALISVANAATNDEELRDGRMNIIIPKLKTLAGHMVDWTDTMMEPSERRILKTQIEACFEIIAASLGDTQNWE